MAAKPAQPAFAPLRIKRFTLGPFETNCYILWPDGQAECWIVDASFGPGPMISFVQEQSLRPSALMLTHAHADHIAGVPEVRKAFPGIPVAIHQAEASWLSDPKRNLSGGYGMPISSTGPDRLLEHGQTLSLAGAECRIIHTPGHSPGGVGLYFPSHDLLIAGDALFAGSIGRTDLPGGDFDTLANAIRERFYTLPDRTVVLPGHGPQTSIGDEKRTNPFVRPE